MEILELHPMKINDLDIARLLSLEIYVNCKT